MKSVCIHAHFYQPSRENPWTQRWEAQPSAAPYSSWNERITDECYAPNVAARLLSDTGETRGFRNTYVDISFDAGPTLLHWLELNRPAVYADIIDADLQSRRKRNGAGSAVAQSYHHSILPLCDARDREIEVAWGLADFERRFGRAARGIWMPETAICLQTLEVLAKNGIEFTIVAPHQISSIRSETSAEWVAPKSVAGFTERPYLVRLASGKTITVFVYDAGLARGVAFDGWLHDGTRLAQQLKDAAILDDGLVHLATDGESYGHHHLQGEMALARALEVLDDSSDVVLSTYEAILDSQPPTWEAIIAEYTSWSCAHGVERWRSDCGCCMNDHQHQRWRGPLRYALNDLRTFARNQMTPLYESVFVDPRAARLEFGRVIGERNEAVRTAWFTQFIKKGADRQIAEQLLALETHLLAMYTSCGWFFDDLNGIEPRQNLRHAACAIGLLKALTGADFASDFQQRIAVIPMNIDNAELLKDLHRWLFEPEVEDTVLPPVHLRRRAGTVLHISALPGDGPIGDLGAVPQMADWMAKAGLEIWQVLPCSPCGHGNSPYSSWSTSSGNPWFIDLDGLREAGLLSDFQSPSGGAEVCFATVKEWKMDLLIEAASNFISDANHPWKTAYRQFVDRAEWLDSASLFWALKRRFDGKPWWEWPKPLSKYQSKAINKIRVECAKDIEVWSVLEFFFDRQWKHARSYLTARGIHLLGDIPIYVGEDSCDVWANRHLFQLDKSGRPTHVAGCPPDGYSEDGQRWGNPLYNWTVMASEGYDWWVRRIQRSLELTDTVRIDHFLGLVRYWSIPADEETARGGEWRKGPGAEFFEVLEQRLGTLPLVVEDLGSIDPVTRNLQETLGFPGMRVLQFAFGSGLANEHLPRNHSEISISYSSTHDSDTVLGWWNSVSDDIQAEVQPMLNASCDLHLGLIDVAFNSKAIWGIAPIQDWLGLGSEARFNVPGTSTGNWQWRLQSNQIESLNPQVVRTHIQYSERLPFRFQTHTSKEGVAK